MKSTYAREPDALGKRAGDERRRDDREFQLKQREQSQRDGGGEQSMRRSADALQHPECARIADEAADTVAEGEAEADDHPQQRNHAHRDEALKHGGDRALAVHHAAIEEGESRRHQQDEARGRQHPGDIAWLDRPPFHRRWSGGRRNPQSTQGEQKSEGQRAGGRRFHVRSFAVGPSLQPQAAWTKDYLTRK